MTEGSGGFSYNDCYNMPSTTRRLFVKKLSDSIDKKNKQIAALRKGDNHLSEDDLAKGDVAKFLQGKTPTVTTKTAPNPKK